MSGSVTSPHHFNANICQSFYDPPPTKRHISVAGAVKQSFSCASLCWLFHADSKSQLKAHLKWAVDPEAR